MLRNPAITLSTRRPKFFRVASWKIETFISAGNEVPTRSFYYFLSLDVLFLLVLMLRRASPRQFFRTYCDRRRHYVTAKFAFLTMNF